MALSQSDIDTLLRAVAQDTESDASIFSENRGPVLFDFSQNERIVHGKMPGLEYIAEMLARHLRTLWHQCFQMGIQVSVGAVRATRSSEFSRNLLIPTALNVIKHQGLGLSWLIFEPNLVFLTVDHVFGGDGRFHTRIEGRDFSYTERRIIDKMALTVLESLDTSWMSVLGTPPLASSVERLELNPQFAALVEPHEQLLALSFTIEINGAAADFHWAIPVRNVSALWSQLSSPMLSVKMKDATVIHPRILSQIEGLCTAEIPLGHFNLEMSKQLALQLEMVSSFGRFSPFARVCVNNHPIGHGPFQWDACSARLTSTDPAPLLVSDFYDSNQVKLNHQHSSQGLLNIELDYSLEIGSSRLFLSRLAQLIQQSEPFPLTAHPFPILKIEGIPKARCRVDHPKDSEFHLQIVELL